MSSAASFTVATWNVNSVRARLPRVLAWLDKARPDVACLQETKVVDADFPAAEIAALGYESVIFGQKTYNGVAILARHAISDVVRGLPDDPADAERRVLAATIGGVRVVNLYCPNGQEVGADKYVFKLDWFRRLRAWFERDFDPAGAVLLCGDFNIVPADLDCWDPEGWRDHVLCSPAERKGFTALLEWGLVDLLRALRPDERVYTWWDYRNGAFHRGWGLRIDHHLGTHSLAARAIGVEVDRDERKGDKPSDHVPVRASFSSCSENDPLLQFPSPVVLARQHGDS